jgi:hypothetical protein
VTEHGVAATLDGHELADTDAELDAIGIRSARAPTGEHLVEDAARLNAAGLKRLDHVGRTAEALRESNEDPRVVDITPACARHRDRPIA